MMQAALAVWLMAGTIAADPPDEDVTRLNGTWVLVRFELDGLAMPAEVVQNSILKFDGKKHTLRMDQDVLDGTHQIDSTQDPKTIDVTGDVGPFKGQVRRGIYRLERDELTLCLAAVGKDRPTQFSAAKGSDQTLTVWKRQAK